MKYVLLYLDCGRKYPSWTRHLCKDSAEGRSNENHSSKKDNYKANVRHTILIVIGETDVLDLHIQRCARPTVDTPRLGVTQAKNTCVLCWITSASPSSMPRASLRLRHGYGTWNRLAILQRYRPDAQHFD